MQLRWHPLVVEHDGDSFVVDDWTFFREVEGGNFDFIEMDILPNIQLSPIRQREYPNAFTLVDPAVVEVPKLGTLVFRIPAMVLVSEREYSLLRS